MCLWLWVNMRIVGNGYRLVDVVLVAQVINAAVGVKKEKLSCDEMWWPLTQAGMQSGGAGLDVDGHVDRCRSW